MDRSIDSPWSWEEEIQWKADLEEREDPFLQQLIDNAVEDSATDLVGFVEAPQPEPSEDSTIEEYLVTA